MDALKYSFAILALLLIGCDIDVYNQDDYNKRDKYLKILTTVDGTEVEVDGEVHHDLGTPFTGVVSISAKADADRRRVNVKAVFSPKDTTATTTTTKDLLAARVGEFAGEDFLQADFSIPDPGKPGIAVVTVAVLKNGGGALGLEERFNIHFVPVKAPPAGPVSNVRIELGALAIHGAWTQEVTVTVVLTDSMGKPIKDQQVDLEARDGTDLVGLFRGSGIDARETGKATGKTGANGKLQATFDSQRRPAMT